MFFVLLSALAVFLSAGVQAAETFDFQRCAETVSKRGDVLHFDGFGLAVTALGAHMHQAA